MPHFFLNLVHSFITEFLICYDGKNGPNLGPINLEKVICSTGFYSPPVMKTEAYNMSQISIESFAAESRGFGHIRWPKLAKFWPFLALFCCIRLPVGSQRSAMAGRYHNNNKKPKFDRN